MVVIWRLVLVLVRIILNSKPTHAICWIHSRFSFLPDITHTHMRMTLRDNRGGHDGKREHDWRMKAGDDGWAVTLNLKVNSHSASTLTLSPFDKSSYPSRTKALSWPQWPISSFPITFPLRQNGGERRHCAPLAEPAQVITYTIAVSLLSAWPAAANDGVWQ